MKIVHCADLHLDSKMTANLTKEQARERKKEILRTFTRMVEYAAKNGVRAILIAGDLFDTRNISAMARNTVRDMICTHPEIDFLYLRGNHDSDNFLSTIEEIPENLLLFGEEWTAYRYGNVVITGMELNERNPVTAYNSLVLGHDDYNIVTLHGQLGNYLSREQAENISLWDMCTVLCRKHWITGESIAIRAVWRDADLTSVGKKALFCLISMSSSIVQPRHSCRLRREPYTHLKSMSPAR